jgi:hypothetical protein
MIHLVLSVCLLIANSAGTTLPLFAAEDTTVSILSPHDGETLTDTFILSYEILNGSKENSAQIYLDGVYQKDFDGTFSHVPKGEHTITVTIDGHDHHGPEQVTDTVKIKVAK